MKKLVLALVAGSVVIVAVGIVNTARFASKQPPAEAAVSIAIDGDTAAAHLAGAIRFPTVSFEDAATVDHEAFAALHDYLERSYPGVHGALTREAINQSSLLYAWPGSEKTLDPVVLMGHLDVVPIVPGTEAQWSHPPFAGAIADGYVWGRGAVDDKSGVIAVLEAVEKLASEGYQPRRTVYLAFGHDEEVGGPEGAAKIVDALTSRGVTHFAFVTDEGGAVGQGLVPGIDKPTALIGIAEKGYLNLRLTVEGEGGHSSTPPSDTNVGILSRAVATLEATPFPARLDGAARDMFEYLGPEMSYGPRLVFANLWLVKPLVERQMLKDPLSAALLRTTTAATMFSAGVKANVLAPRATAVMNFRIKPGETVESVKAFAGQVINDARVKIEPLGDANDPSPASDTASPAFEVMTRTIRQVLGNDVVVSPMLVMGGTDAKYFSHRSPNVFRFLPVVITPGDFKRFHGTNERLSIDSLATSVRYFYQLVKNIDAM